MVAADVKNGRAFAHVTGDNHLLNGTIALDALMNKNKLDGTINCRHGTVRPLPPPFG